MATEQTEEQGLSWTSQKEEVACNLERAQLVENEEQQQGAVQCGKEAVLGEQEPELHHWPEEDHWREGWAHCHRESASRDEQQGDGEVHEEDSHREAKSSLEEVLDHKEQGQARPARWGHILDGEASFLVDQSPS